MKNIQITYLNINDIIENSIVSIALDYPNYNLKRECYLYELFYSESLENLIKLREENISQYGYLNGELAPFYLKIDDNTYENLIEYLSNPTEYEDCKWQDDVSLLNAIIGIYRKDPKNWET